MLDTKDLVNTLRQIVKETVEASSPSNFVFGTVISEKPLSIKVDQKTTLVEEQLILCRDVTEYETKVTIGVSKTADGTFLGETWDETYVGGSADEGCDHLPSAVPLHHHKLKFARHIKTKIVVHNELKLGEKVALMQEQGGQRYLVIDRVVAL